MHSSENATSLKDRNIKGNIAEVKTTSANVEFVILPYYKTLEDIPEAK